MINIAYVEYELAVNATHFCRSHGAAILPLAEDWKWHQLLRAQEMTNKLQKTGEPVFISFFKLFSKWLVLSDMPFLSSHIFKVSFSSQKIKRMWLEYTVLWGAYYLDLRILPGNNLSRDGQFNCWRTVQFFISATWEGWGWGASQDLP